MGYSTTIQPLGQSFSECGEQVRPAEQKLARSLRTMVRRVLRRRRSRTRFEGRVLAEARRLGEDHGCEFSGDALARRVTDRLLATTNRNELLRQVDGMGDPHVVTWTNAVGNTLALPTA